MDGFGWMIAWRICLDEGGGIAVGLSMSAHHTPAPSNDQVHKSAQGGMRPTYLILAQLGEEALRQVQRPKEVDLVGERERERGKHTQMRCSASFSYMLHHALLPVHPPPSFSTNNTPTFTQTRDIQATDLKHAAEAGQGVELEGKLLGHPRVVYQPDQGRPLRLELRQEGRRALRDVGLHGCWDGWMDGWMGGWMDGWVCGWMIRVCR